jgi:hypothetical protein
MEIAAPAPRTSIDAGDGGVSADIRQWRCSRAGACLLEVKGLYYSRNHTSMELEMQPLAARKVSVLASHLSDLTPLWLQRCRPIGPMNVMRRACTLDFEVRRVPMCV